MASFFEELSESAELEIALTQQAAKAKAEDIGHAIEHIVKTFRYWQQHKEAPEPVVHLENMLSSLLRVLATKDVPIAEH
jgi:uncharacterized protein YdaL